MSVLIILGSARKDSHTRTLVSTVFRDVSTDLIDLLDFNIATFDYGAVYPKEDEFGKVVAKMIEADTIVFATPVYWYAMSGVMKKFFDRFTDLLKEGDVRGDQLAGKRILMLAVGADAHHPDGFEVPFKRTAEYFDMKYIAGAYFSSRSESFENIEYIAQSFLQKLRS
jgi:multimeric flavodoxin WrbA